MHSKTIIYFTYLCLIVFLIFMFVLFAPSAVYSSDTSTANSSAQLSVEREQKTDQYTDLIQTITIQNILRRSNSPLLPYAPVFVSTAKHYNLNCYLLPAIARLESLFGHQVIAGTHNPFGWGSGKIVWKNWGEGIFHVGRSLRFNYIDRGATTISAIGKKYAESPTWANRISGFIAQFEIEEKNVRRQLESQIQKKV